MRIKKVINNNILCAIDEKGNEVIVTGKGIGFKRYTGEVIEQEKIEKIYRMESKEEQKKLRELVEQIPLEHLRLTQELIDDISIQIAGEYYHKQWNEESVDFSRFVVHLRYLIWRTFQGKGMETKEKEEDILFREMVQQNYKEHYFCAQQIVSYVQEMCGKSISDEETVYMTIHLKLLSRDEES